MNTRVTIQEPPRSLIYRGAVFAYGVAAYVGGVVALLAVILILLGVFHFTGGALGELGLSAAITIDWRSGVNTE